MDKLKQYKLKQSLGIFLIVLVSVLLILFAVGGFLFGINCFSLMVIPTGNPEVELEYGSDYQELGAEVRIVGTLVFRSGIPVDTTVTTSGTVNTDVLGTYKVDYHTSWHHWEGTGKRIVHVVDNTPPEIHLISADTKYTVVGEPYIEEGYTAVDAYDGDLTYRVRAVEQDGVITYKVSDNSGNETVVQRQIRYYDPVVPTIVLSSGTVSVPAGDDYLEPGYSAWDNGDGNITEWVEIYSDFNKYLAGTYKMTYVVSDSQGNETKAEREIIVTPKELPEEVMPEGKVIYLTFDDGPSEHTRKLLKILNDNEVLATFFVCDRDEYDVLSEIVDLGHTIAIHSRTHNYGKIYESVDAYFADLLFMRSRILELTGMETNLVRFPGGSSNTVSKFNPGIMTTLAKAVQDCGFTYYDWNVDSNDAGGAKTADEVFRNVTNGIEWAMERYGFAIVLQHDTQEFSIDAVARIIQWGKENGYTFLPLENNSPTIHHDINN